MDIALLVMLDMFAVGIILARLKTLSHRLIFAVFAGFFVFHLILGLVLASYEPAYVDPSYYGSTVN